MSLLSNQKKMFFPLFISLIFSRTSENLSPPFVIKSGNKIGYWELGGNSVVNKNLIKLIPPIKNTKGSLWTNASIPKDDTWGITFCFQIPQAESGTFALWFVKNYRENGTFCGGPNVFEGAALVNIYKL